MPPAPPSLPPFVCPRTRGPLRDGLYSPEAQVTYPTVEDIPLLVPEPVAFLGRTGVRKLADANVARIGLPDPLTPHLPPTLFAAPGGFGQWLATVGDSCPDTTCAGFGERFAPAGAALDVGCGVGGMTRRMVAAGRATAALDLSLDAVLTARGLLCGLLHQTTIPTHRNGRRTVKVPFHPITQGLSFCVADAADPPFSPESFAWVHLGEVLDDAGPKAGDVLVAAVELLQPRGLLTIATRYAGIGPIDEEAPAPDDELLEALDGLGLQPVEQADRIPRVVRRYDRSFEVHFVHCIAAVRS